MTEALQQTPSPVAQERLNSAVETQKGLRHGATQAMYVVFVMTC